MGEAGVVQEFMSLLGPDTSVPVAAIKVLIGVIRSSKAATVMGMERELREVSNLLQVSHWRVEWDSVVQNNLLKYKSTISLRSGCELFQRYVTRCSFDFPDFEMCKQQVLQRGEKFAEMSATSRTRIAELGQASYQLSGFVRDGAVIMIYGNSRVAVGLLLKAAERAHFRIIMPEGRLAGRSDLAAAKVLNEAGIPVHVVLDTALGYFMEQVSFCLVGAEGVVENGGIINKVGTYQMAITAKAFKKPFYVAAESYKFARLLPLNQQDLPKGRNPEADISVDDPLPEGISVSNPCCDYTPADYITLLFTDLGVLTPSAVSDELIMLYQ
ncbi:unnamed protein product [Chrysoparadoxa australica]